MTEQVEKTDFRVEKEVLDLNSTHARLKTARDEYTAAVEALAQHPFGAMGVSRFARRERAWQELSAAIDAVLGSQIALTGFPHAATQEP